MIPRRIPHNVYVQNNNKQAFEILTIFKSFDRVGRAPDHPAAYHSTPYRWTDPPAGCKPDSGSTAALEDFREYLTGIITGDLVSSEVLLSPYYCVSSMIPSFFVPPTSSGENY
jgi:hypothetical protein